MSRGTVFGNSSNMTNDLDYITCVNNQNDKFSQYNLTSFRPQSNYVNSMGEIGVYHNQQNTVRGHNIDMESQIRNGEKGNVITNNKSKAEKNLDPRSYTTMPFTGPGTRSVKTDVEDQLQRGALTNSKRSEDQQQFRNTFIPLIPEMEDAISNVDHYVERNWTRGGISTRSVKQNVDYAKSRGLIR